MAMCRRDMAARALSSLSFWPHVTGSIEQSQSNQAKGSQSQSKLVKSRSKSVKSQSKSIKNLYLSEMINTEQKETLPSLWLALCWTRVKCAARFLSAFATRVW